MTLDGGSVSFRPGMVKAFSFVQSGKLAWIVLCHEMQPPTVVSVLISKMNGLQINGLEIHRILVFWSKK